MATSTFTKLINVNRVLYFYLSFYIGCRVVDVVWGRRGWVARMYKGKHKEHPFTTMEI